MFKRIGAALILLLTFMYMVVPVQASQEQEYHLSLSFADTKTERGFGEAEFRIYQVALLDDQNEISVCKDFLELNTDWSSALQNPENLAMTLESYVAQNQVQPLKSGWTDENGNLAFDLSEKGLYLICGSRYEWENQIIAPSAALISLPLYEEGSDQPLDIVQAQIKYELLQNETEYISKTVVKKWINDTDSIRPKSISVDLFQDGQKIDTQILSEENNWQYTWTNLEAGFYYQIAEQSVENYSVQLSRSKDIFYLNNTYEEQPQTPSEPKTPGKPSIPRSGTDLYKIPGYLCSGLFLIAGGLLVKPKE